MADICLCVFSTLLELSPAFVNRVENGTNPISPKRVVDQRIGRMVTIDDESKKGSVETDNRGLQTVSHQRHPSQWENARVDFVSHHFDDDY